MAEESKEPRRRGPSQRTLDAFEGTEDSDEEYGHLTAHLVEGAPRQAERHQWTRVFTRAEVLSLQISLHELGPDLIYDKSVREAAAQSTDVRGALVFSPTLFEARDLNRGLAESQISLDSLIGLGELATKAKQRFEGPGRPPLTTISYERTPLGGPTQSQAL